MILFHALKHHLGYLRALACSPPDTWLQRIKTIGASQMDLYTGALSVEAICTEIHAQLQLSGHAEAEAYKAWVLAHDGYRQIKLSDHSEWTLRIGQGQDFVHVHPGRHTAHTIRVKAGVLKTALLAIALGPGLSPQARRDKDFLNRARAQAGLPPIKAVEESAHLLEVLAWLEEKSLGE